MGPSARTKYFKDQRRPVQDFTVPRDFQVPLLNRGQFMIDNGYIDLIRLNKCGNIIGLTTTEQRCRPYSRDIHDFRCDELKINRFGQADSFLPFQLESVQIPGKSGQIWNDD